MIRRTIRGKIAVRTDRIRIIHPASEPVVRWCPVCRADTPMVVPDEAARRCNINVRLVYQEMDAGKVHFIELSGGALVCLNSFQKR